jgi:hypothetical protein
MTVTAKHYAEMFRRFQAPISKVYDCGAKCAPLNGGQPVCCDSGHAIPIVEHTEWDLLHSRTDMWHKFKPKNKGEANEVADLKGSDCRAVECNGAAHCERDNRSLACRTFPFFPYFNAEKELIGLSYYWSFEGLCWVISNITIVEKPFIRQFMDVHEYLFKADEHWRDTYIAQSSTMRGVYSRKNERFPVVLRDGSYHWVLPRSGGKMIPATKADLAKLKKRWNPDKIGVEA